MFARHKQDAAKALFAERARLAHHFVYRKCHSQDRVVARKAAVQAVIDALVGKIQRREEANDPAETLLRQLMRPPRKYFKKFRSRRGNQVREIRQ